jgi:site-specific DNA recombinase
VIAEQFGHIIGALKMDTNVLSWVVTALKESHKDEKQHHDDLVQRFQDKYKTLQRRIDAMYIDKLDGKITQDFYDLKSSGWREEQTAVLEKIERHQGANKAYIGEGVKLLELAQRAVTLYKKQDMLKKRRIINFVCSNSIWKGGKVHPNYRQPFDMIAENNTSWEKEKALSCGESAIFENWYGISQ